MTSTVIHTSAPTELQLESRHPIYYNALEGGCVSKWPFFELCDRGFDHLLFLSGPR